MKANELMIGDWVRIKCNPCKVSYLSYFDIGDARLAVISNDYDGNPYLDEIEPIPLTTEILKVNGFKQYEEYENTFVLYTDLLDEFGNPYTILISGEEFICYEMKVFLEEEVTDEPDLILPDFKHVHELQHALKLSSLTELADNFKIE